VNKSKWPPAKNELQLLATELHGHMRAAIEITQHPQRARGNSRCKPYRST
jgi:hypothetical protein